MTLVPKLLNTDNAVLLPKQLFSDLQLDLILSAQTITVLQQPCGSDEIVHRNELFTLLDRDENDVRINHTLSLLSVNERALYLLKNTEIPLDRYYRLQELFEAYIVSCEALASIGELGSLFSHVADYFSSNEKKNLLADMKESLKKIKNLLTKMNKGLLSFAYENWLTPEYGAVSEFDSIAACAQNLGFSVTSPKIHNTKINLSLSDAICRLYADEVALIESEVSKYANIDFYEPTVYIPEIKFFLEIHNLMKRASKIGVPCCIATVASSPCYIASELYDVSLLAKKCEMIVPNNADFTENEPFYFLIGANGGGKTTYLRAVGINLLLFLSGCPVFAKKAEIYPFDIVLSHFPSDERFDNTGRLDEERKRAEQMIMESENKAAFLFFNETFSGADGKRGFELLTDIAAKTAKRNYFGIYVTHFHGVVSLAYPVLWAEVDVTDDNKRTFHIVKSKGNALSYAADILRKYRLDQNSLDERRRGDYGD